MALSFGSDEFFFRLKDLYAGGDADQLFRELKAPLDSVIQMTLRKTRYGALTCEDKKDAGQEARIFVLEHIGGFLNDARNDPTSDAEKHFSPRERQSWLIRGVMMGCDRVLDRVTKHGFSPSLSKPEDGGPRDFEIQLKDGTRLWRVDSFDRPMGDSDRSALDALPSAQKTPEERLLLRARLREALEALFSLNNTPEVLASVGYVILSEALVEHKPLEAYVRQLNGTAVRDLIFDMAGILREHGVDPVALAPLWARVKDADEDLTITGLTPKHITNRKNSMLTMLRRNVGREEDDPNE